MSSDPVNKTKNSSLQEALEQWVEKLSDLYERMSAPEIVSLSDADRQQALWRPMDEFVRSFVPLDVTEEDISHYRDSLLGDEEFFISLLRELAQCATGQRVESVQGDQTRKATFILLPPPELLADGSNLDIVRELSFIAVDASGTRWRAEG